MSLGSKCSGTSSCLFDNHISAPSQSPLLPIFVCIIVAYFFNWMEFVLIESFKGNHVLCGPKYYWFIQKIFIEGSLCVKHSSRNLGHMSEQNRQNSKRNTIWYTFCDRLIILRWIPQDSSELFSYTAGTNYMFKFI